MTRRPLSSPAVPKEASTSYQVWLQPEQIELIKSAAVFSGIAGPKWTQEAVARLKREDETELRSLMAAWQKDRTGKEIFSFRLFPSTLKEAREIAKEHGGTVQAVFAHAHFMQAFAATSKTTKASDQSSVSPAI